MPYGNTQELIGANINPALFIQDYSPYERQNMMDRAAIAANIQNIQTTATDYAKEQKAAKNTLKASQAQIEAAATLFPDQAPYLSQISNQLKNEDTPLSERAAIGSQVADIINMGVGQKRYETELAFKRQDQANQNQESAMRQWAYGQQVTAAEQEARARQTDAKTKATIGPGLLENVLKLAPASIADNVRKSIGDYTPEEQFSLASSVMALIPKADKKTAPTVQDVAVPGGTQKMQWDETSGTWIPIQTSLQPKGAKVTTFGSPDDPYLDSNSAKGIGAFGKLEPNDIALSPDMEKEVRAKGIKPGDNISVTMENGDVVQGRWMDRTAQDSDVKSGKIKGVTQPLRGRVDIYTPGGVNPYDGMGVSAIGFTPAKDAALSPSEQIAVQKYQDEKAAQVAKDSSAAAAAKDFVGVLDELQNHPGFTNLFGSNVGIPTWIPGSSGADAKAILGKVQGKAFLEAIQKMKGMGALSEKEGETATKAYTALTPSMSEEAARKEIATLKGILMSGIQKAATTDQSATPPVDPIQAASQKLQGLVPAR